MSVSIAILSKRFGAASVMCSHIRGRTNTLPLYVEILYNE
jgi:ABC-type sulfate transport system permease subunit